MKRRGTHKCPKGCREDPDQLYENYERRNLRWFTLRLLEPLGWAANIPIFVIAVDGQINVITGEWSEKE